MSRTLHDLKSFWQFSAAQLLILTGLLAVIAAMNTFANRMPLKLAAMVQDAKVAGVRNTALGEAVSVQNRVLVSEYLKKGADPNASYKGTRVVDLCLRNGDMNSLRLLFEAGADFTDYWKVIESKLTVAEKIEIIHILVRQDAAIIEAVTRHAVMYSEPEIIDFLRLSGSDYGLREMATLGRLEELQAVINGDPSLLRKRVGPIFACKPGQEPTLLGIALRRGHEEMANWLIDNGADVQSLEEFGNSPLFMAAGGNCVSVIKRLCDMGCDPNATDDDLETPLTYWGSRCNKDTILALVKAGADVNAQNSRKWTPLHCALSRQDSVEEVVEILLDAGANPLLVDKDGKSPRDWAIVKSPALVPLFDKALAKNVPQP
jgi:ankyrin repeat protein